MECPGCHEPLPEGAAFCPHCGRGFDTIPATVPAPRDSVPATLDIGTAETMATPAPAGDTAPESPRARAGAAGRKPIKEPADPLLDTVVAGRFRVRERIGAGGMGTVYLAEQTAVDRAVVLKFLHPHLFRQADLVERFHREALAASKLTCPNTIVLHDFGQTEAGTLYMAMEYLEGRPLSALIAGAGALPALRAIGVTLQILSSLEEAHDKGIVHRDLKPDNIMLVRRAGTADFVKVLDFGIAKLVGQEEPPPGAPSDDGPIAAESSRPLTRDGAICGSPGYMAPEQVLGGEVDHRADLYAVGVILYEMLSGHRPFQGGNLIELMDFAAEGNVDSLCDSRPDLALPRPLDRLLLRCLDRDPAKRPASATELARALRELTPQIARHQQEQERALMELVGIRRRWTRRSRLLPLLGAVLLAAALALWIVLRPTGSGHGVALAPGERLFVSASAARVPPWVAGDVASGVRGEIRDQPDSTRAIDLARAAVLARMADVPPRFDPLRERRQYLADLEALRQQGRTLEDGRGRRFLDSIATFWVRLAVGRRGGEPAYRYDGYAHASALPPELGHELRRLFAETRYDRYSFLTDEAVRRKRCDRARTLARKVEETIVDMDLKKAKRDRLRFILGLRLKPCPGDTAATGPTQPQQETRRDR